MDELLPLYQAILFDDHKRAHLVGGALVYVVDDALVIGDEVVSAVGLGEPAQK